MDTTVTTHTSPLLISLLHLAVSALALMLTAYFVPGFKVGTFGSALLAAFVVGIVNALLRPILLILTLPINVLTLGLFTFVVNAIILKICAAIVPNFDITSWGSAIIGAIILAVTGALLHMILI